MGWKASMIIIHQPTKIGNEQLLEELGFKGLTKIKDEPFDDVLNPSAHKVFIGVHNNNLVICTVDIPLKLIEANDTPIERRFIELFPNSEICAIVLHSTVNLWGYSIIKNGQKIRARAGCADDGTYLEMGEPLAEEKELLSKSKLDSNGKRIYLFEDLPDEPLQEDQVGENFVFFICYKYLDEELDSAETSLHETILQGYRYRVITPDKTTANAAPWWKFW